MIEVRRLAGWEEAAAVHDAWNGLLSGAGAGLSALPSVFQSYEWNHSWWRAFGAGHEPLLLAAFDAGRLVGIAPLMISRERRPLPTKVVRIMGGMNFASDFCGFAREAGREDVLAAFGDWLDANPALWHELEWMNLLEDSAELTHFRGRFEAGRMKTALTFLYDAPTRMLGVAEEDKDLVSRDSLKRHTNWFKKQGELRVGHRESPAEILSSLDAFFEQHVQRRAAAGGKSQFKDEREREFYRILVDAFSKTGWLRFFVVELNGAPLAYHFGFEFAGKFYWYKPTFDVQYIKKSPGEVLLKALFEYSIERKLKEFDFTAGSEGFKYRFANHIRKLYLLRAFRSRPHYVAYVVIEGARSLKRRFVRNNKQLQ